MLQQPIKFRIAHDEPGFDLAQAARAPQPQQVAAPVPNGAKATGESGVPMFLQVFADAVGGACLLGVLLMLPYLLGRLSGLG